jgi:hypothetical protein
MPQRLVIPLLAAILAIGCSQSTVVPVSGTVTLDGKPLPGVHVAFQPLARPGQQDPGVGSYALTAADGKFTLLMTDGERPGAVAGKHRVEITSRSEVPDNIDLPTRPPPKVLIPAKYNRDSELTFEVPPVGTTTANFDLKTR